MFVNNFSGNNTHDYSSDGIEFVNSDGEVVDYEDDDDDNDDVEESQTNSNFQQLTKHSPKYEVQVMYIQMEFCEKSTLRLVFNSTHTHYVVNNIFMK